MADFKSFLKQYKKNEFNKLTHTTFGDKYIMGSYSIPDYDIDGPLRIGVFSCHCGSNIAGVVDVENVKNYAINLPDVVYADDLLFACFL